jgi:hypothetical protein
MNLTTLLANFALIKITYVIFFLVLVVVINVSLLRKRKKIEDETGNPDIHVADSKVCCRSIDEITSKN